MQVSAQINTCPLSPHLITGVWELAFSRLSQILKAIVDSFPFFEDSTILTILSGVICFEGKVKVRWTGENSLNVPITGFSRGIKKVLYDF